MGNDESKKSKQCDAEVIREPDIEMKKIADQE
jgi:hypothetical protein